MTTSPTSFSTIFSSKAHTWSPFTHELTYTNKDNATQVHTFKLTTLQKVAAVATAIFAGLITLPLLIIGGLAIGYCVFRLITAIQKDLSCDDHIKGLIQVQNLKPKDEDRPVPKLTEEELNSLTLQIGAAVLAIKTMEQKLNALKDKPTADLSDYERQLHENEVSQLESDIKSKELERIELLNKTRKNDAPAVPSVKKTTTKEEAEANRKIKAEQDKRLRLEQQDKANKAKKLKKANCIKAEEEIRAIALKYGLTLKDVAEVAQKVYREPQNQIPIPADDAKLLPYTQPIAAGLYNPSNACWLNSALKHLATTEWGDRICEAKVDKQYIKFQNTLRKILISIREGQQDQVVNIKLMNKFYRLIKETKMMGDEDPRIPNKQHDSKEFISIICSRLNINILFAAHQLYNFNEEEIAVFPLYHCHLVDVYESLSEGNAFKLPTDCGYSKFPTLQCTKFDLDKKEIDLNMILLRTENLEDEVMSDSILNKGTNEITRAENGPGIKVKRAQFLTHAPLQLSLRLERNVTTSNQDWLTPQKCHGTVKTTSFKGNQHTIMLYEFEESLNRLAFENQHNMTRPKSECYYRIKGFNAHHGDSRGGGHYTYFEFKDGQYYRHNDSKVSKISSDELPRWLESAVSLELELIEKVDFQGFPEGYAPEDIDMTHEKYVAKQTLLSKIKSLFSSSHDEKSKTQNKTV